MAFPGFVPVRQLVLVDLLSLILSVRPGERAVVAVDGVEGITRARVTREVMALAEHMAGRQLVAVAMDAFRHPGAFAPQHQDDGQAYYLGAFDYQAFADVVLRPYRAGGDICGELAGSEQTVSPRGDLGPPELPAPQQIDEDAVLLIDGTFLHRPELVSRWDASVFVRSAADASGPLSAYLEQSPDLQATWVLDNTASTAPLLTFGATVGPTP